MNRYLSRLGKPDITMAGLEIWVSGREHPDRTDYWDGNWLKGVFRCHTKDSEIWVKDPEFHGSGFKYLRDGLCRMYAAGEGKAELDTTGPNLSVQFEYESTNEIKMKVDITPNQVFEQHQYLFQIYRADLKAYIMQLSDVLERYPLVGTTTGG